MCRLPRSSGKIESVCHIGDNDEEFLNLAQTLRENKMPDFIKVMHIVRTFNLLCSATKTIYILIGTLVFRVEFVTFEIGLDIKAKRRSLQVANPTHNLMLSQRK